MKRSIYSEMRGEVRFEVRRGGAAGHGLLRLLAKLSLTARLCTP